MPVSVKYDVSMADVEEIFHTVINYTNHASLFKACYWSIIAFFGVSMLSPAADYRVAVFLILISTAGMLIMLYCWEERVKECTNRMGDDLIQSVKVVFGENITAHLDNDDIAIDYSGINCILRSKHFWLLLCENGVTIPVYKHGLKRKEQRIVLKAITRYAKFKF